MPCVWNSAVLPELLLSDWTGRGGRRSLHSSHLLLWLWGGHLPEVRPWRQLFSFGSAAVCARKTTHCSASWDRCAPVSYSFEKHEEPCLRTSLLRLMLTVLILPLSSFSPPWQFCSTFLMIILMWNFQLSLIFYPHVVRISPFVMSSWFWIHTYHRPMYI